MTAKSESPIFLPTLLVQSIYLQQCVYIIQYTYYRNKKRKFHLLLLYVFNYVTTKHFFFALEKDNHFCTSQNLQFDKQKFCIQLVQWNMFHQGFCNSTQNTGLKGALCLEMYQEPHRNLISGQEKNENFSLIIGSISKAESQKNSKLYF